MALTLACACYEKIMGLTGNRDWANLHVPLSKASLCELVVQALKSIVCSPNQSHRGRNYISYLGMECDSGQMQFRRAIAKIKSPLKRETFPINPLVGR